MTAFKNGRAALAVTAGLVGALSLGSAAIAAAPVSAYAEASAQAEKTPQEIFADGDATVETGNGKTITSGASFAPGQLGKSDTGVMFTDANVDTADDSYGFDDVTVYALFDSNDNGKFDDDRNDYSVNKLPLNSGETDWTDHEGHYLLKVVLNSDPSYVLYVPFEISKDAESKVAFYWDGEQVNGTKETVYSSLDKLDSLTVKAWDGSDELKEGTDYELVVKDADGDAVSEVVDRGTYTVALKPLSDKFSEVTKAKLTIKVHALDLSEATVRATGQNASGKFSYTGSEIVPGFQFAADPAYKADGTTLDEDKTVWADIPAAVYDVTYTNVANKKAALKDEGTYTATLRVKGTKDGNFKSVNVTVPGIEVSAEQSFTDVSNAAWYADSVYKAASEELGYMTGIAGTATFDPEGSLTRGQAVKVLFNMAGGEDSYSDENEFGYVEGYGFKSYSDVDSHAWYAEAVAWAKAYGVVSGYPDGTFKPEQAVTREEFAQMLQNYAAKTQQGTDAKADLSSYTDANTLGWGRDAVAWAVANKAMGQGTTVLNPEGQIKRAEVAAMTTRFQAEKLTSPITK